MVNHYHLGAAGAPGLFGSKVICTAEGPRVSRACEMPNCGGCLDIKLGRQVQMEDRASAALVYVQRAFFGMRGRTLRAAGLGRPSVPSCSSSSFLRFFSLHSGSSHRTTKSSDLILLTLTTVLPVSSMTCSLTYSSCSEMVSTGHEGERQAVHLAGNVDVDLQHGLVQEEDREVVQVGAAKALG